MTVGNTHDSSEKPVLVKGVNSCDFHTSNLHIYDMLNDFNLNTSSNIREHNTYHVKNFIIQNDYYYYYF